MPLSFLNLFGSQLAKISIVTSVPLSFLLIGLQAIMDVKFSCPCSLWWNRAISALILIAPAIFSLVVMLLLVRPCGNMNCCKAFLVCLIPCLVWICIFFIDGDYLACGLTYWKGRYTCDKEQCFSWCKPNNLPQGKTETNYYDETQEFIFISKAAGYGLAIFFCVITIIIIVCCGCDYFISGGSADPGPYRLRVRQQRQGPGSDQPNDITELNNMN